VTRKYNWLADNENDPSQRAKATGDIETLILERLNKRLMYMATRESEQ
jgi:hypothetical protein